MSNKTKKWNSSMMLARQAKGARFALKAKPRGVYDSKVAGLVRLYLNASSLDAATVVQRLEEVLGDEVSKYVEITHIDAVRE